MESSEQFRTMSRANQVIIFVLNLAVLAVGTLLLRQNAQQEALRRAREAIETGQPLAPMGQIQQRIVTHREDILRKVSANAGLEEQTTTTTTTKKSATTYPPAPGETTTTPNGTTRSS